MWCAFYMGKMKTKCIRKLSIRRKGWNLPHLAVSLRLDQGGKCLFKIFVSFVQYIYLFLSDSKGSPWVMHISPENQNRMRKLGKYPGKKPFSGKYQAFMGIYKMNDSKRKVKNNVSKQNMFVSHLKRILFIYLFIIYAV